MEYTQFDTDLFEGFYGKSKDVYYLSQKNIFIVPNIENILLTHCCS